MKKSTKRLSLVVTKRLHRNLLRIFHCKTATQASRWNAYEKRG